jgi:hypothetical protein
MSNNKQQTAVEWLVEQLENHRATFFKLNEKEERIITLAGKDVVQQAKEMEKEQRGYTKEDVLKAGEMGEINHHDTKHIVSYLDEARDFNETYGGTE